VRLAIRSARVSAKPSIPKRAVTNELCYF